MKLVTGLLIGGLALVVGLAAYFFVIVRPRNSATIQAGAPKPLPSAQPLPAPSIAQTAIQTTPALLDAIGGLYGAVTRDP